MSLLMQAERENDAAAKALQDQRDREYIRSILAAEAYDSGTRAFINGETNSVVTLTESIPEDKLVEILKAVKEAENVEATEELSGDTIKTFFIPVEAIYHPRFVSIDYIYKFVLNVVRSCGIPPLKLQGSEEIIVWSVYKAIEKELDKNNEFYGATSWQQVRLHLASNNFGMDESSFKSFLVTKYINEIMLYVVRVNIEKDTSATPEQKRERHYQISQITGESMFDNDYDLLIAELDRDEMNFAQIQKHCWETIQGCRSFLHELEALGGVYDRAMKFLPTKQYKVTCSFDALNRLDDLLKEAINLLDQSPIDVLI